MNLAYFSTDHGSGQLLSAQFRAGLEIPTLELASFVPQKKTQKSPFSEKVQSMIIYVHARGFDPTQS